MSTVFTVSMVRRDLSGSIVVQPSPFLNRGGISGGGGESAVLHAGGNTDEKYLNEDRKDKKGE